MALGWRQGSAPVHLPRRRVLDQQFPNRSWSTSRQTVREHGDTTSCDNHCHSLFLPVDTLFPLGLNESQQVGFRPALPETLLRLQRREYYRLQVPVTQPLECAIPQHHPDGETTYERYRVLDISGGGIALAVQAENPTLRPYREFPDCLLYLPDGGPLSLRLMVKSLHSQLNQNGTESWRAGCQFTDLPRGADALIQRYIFRLERQRSARERGAA